MEIELLSLMSIASASCVSMLGRHISLNLSNRASTMNGGCHLFLHGLLPSRWMQFSHRRGLRFLWRSILLHRCLMGQRSMILACCRGSSFATVEFCSIFYSVEFCSILFLAVLTSACLVWLCINKILFGRPTQISNNSQII